MDIKQPKKLLIINILNILNKYTDENHKISQSRILDILNREYNMNVNRKSIKPNIMDLIDAGFDINYTETQRGNNDSVLTDFYINHTFTDEELRLIIDSLLFSKYIPSGQCRELIEKISDLSSIYFRGRIKNVKNMPERHIINKEIFYTISVIDEAIEKNLCVSFCYTYYNTDKKPQKKKNSNGEDKVYIVSPYQMVTANGRYYLIANSNNYDNISYYRVDKIAEITCTDMQAKPLNKIKGCENGLDLPKHMAEHIYMFSGESLSVIFKVKKSAVNQVLDWFGTEVVFYEETEDEVTAKVVVNPNAMKYWALQYADYVRIISPESLVENIKSTLKEALDGYNK